MAHPRRSRIARAAWMAGALLVLLAVFSLYGRPAFLVTMIDQLWSCF
jgi:hypothetical protein